MSAYDQFEIRRRRLRDGRTGPSAYQVFEFPKTLNVNPETAFPRGTPWPFGTGNANPVLTDYDFDTDYSPGTQLLRVNYRTPTSEEWLELNAPHAILLTRYGLNSRRIKIDANGNTLEGRDPADLTGSTIRRITQGSNLVYWPGGTHRVHGVVHDTYAYRDQIVPHIGNYNAGPIPLIANAATGTLLLAGIHFSPKPYRDQNGRKLYSVDYDFLYSVILWNQVCRSMAFRIKSLEVPVIDNTGVATGEIAQSTVLVPDPNGTVSGSVGTIDNTFLTGWSFLPVQLLLSGSW